MLSDQLKYKIIDFIEQNTGVKIAGTIISVPPKPELGDLAVPLFTLAKATGKNPPQLAHELSTLKAPEGFSKMIPVGPYLNFFIDAQSVSEDLVPEILKKKEKFSRLEVGRGQRVMVEYFSPNTNKPMTVGHLRNLTLGSSISKLYQKIGYEVIRSTLFNDRGIAICKSMVAYDLFGKGQTPKKSKKKSDQFVGDYYVLFGREAEKDPKLEEMAKEYLLLWEKGDKRIRALWKKMNSWVYAGMRETLKKLHEEKFDQIYFESDFYQHAKDIVLQNVNKGVIKQGPDGEIFADLESKNVPNKILLRSDGTSLYVTQDLYLAHLKNQSDIDKSIYVVADEQNMQLQQLFLILESLGERSDKYYHLSYGMMRLPEGKIKSREGFGRALADGLIGELEALAYAEVEKRNPKLPKKKKEKISNQIMNAALKFYILNVDPKKTMIFDPEEAVSFTGKTGPYLQYTGVRINSILKDAVKGKPQYQLLTHELEKQLINLLAKYKEVVSEAAANNDPSHVSKYLYELAQLTNHYYHDVPVLKAAGAIAATRCALLKAVGIALKDGLDICGIEIPEKM